jgi:Mrp family chromosome partitioning ATPase
MSAIDNAFIRAFTTDAAGVGAAQTKSAASTLPASATAKTSKTTIAPSSDRGNKNAPMAAANRVNRPHFKPSALRSNVEHTIVPVPHIDLSKFAYTATTLDQPPATVPVRIDPPAVARGPHVATRLGARDLGLGTNTSTIGAESRAERPLPHSTVRQAQGSWQAGPLPEGERDVEEEISDPSNAPRTTHHAPRATHHAPRPAFEVDRFAWPEPSDALIERIGPQADELAQELMAEAALGRNVIAVGGDSRGAGATTLALVLGRQLAKSGAKVALVDADFAAPQLAGQLGLVIGIGWETVLALPEKTSLWETMVESIEDRLTVVPLASRSRLNVSGAIAERLADCLGQLSEAFDLVLVDIGPMSLTDPKASWLTAPGNGLDAAILACDVRSAEAERLTVLSRRLMDANIPALGVAENFCA